MKKQIKLVNPYRNYWEELIISPELQVWFLQFCAMSRKM